MISWLKRVVYEGKVKVCLYNLHINQIYGQERKNKKVELYTQNHDGKVNVEGFPNFQQGWMYYVHVMSMVKCSSCRMSHRNIQPMNYKSYLTQMYSTLPSNSLLVG